MATTLTGIVLCALFATSTFAHPGSGIVVDKQGQIFFTDTGQGVWKIDKQGKLTYLPASLWHWMAIDEVGYFQMDRDGVNQLPVTRNSHVIGMLSREDVITFLRTLQELGS